MTYKYHQIWRDKLGIGAGWQDVPSEYNFKNHLKNLRRSHPRIPYTIEIECNSYWGNFEREFIGYSMGILDDVQMDIDHSEEERTTFWQEVFNQDVPISFETALGSYELLMDYLFETFQEVDDWEQLTFYQIDWDAYRQEHRHILRVQLAKPLNDYWESVVIPRMKNFFITWMHENTQLIGIALYDSKHNCIKTY
jgi:hypothetical protein